MSARENRPQVEAAPEAFGGAETNDTAPAASGATAPADAGPRVTTRFEETVYEEVTEAYLAEIADDSARSLRVIRDELLAQLRLHISLLNVEQGLKGPSAFQLPKQLNEITVVRVLLARYHIVGIDLSRGQVDDMELLGLYSWSGPDEGIYLIAESVFERLISELTPNCTSRSIDSIRTRLRSHAPVQERTLDPHRSPVRNGIYNSLTGELEPFSPKSIYLSKISVDYDPAATSPVIDTPDGDVWEVEEWMRTLSDDPEVVELLWEIIGACVRPFFKWDRTAWLMSERGNNGKGTLIELMRNLLGARACASVPVAKFGDRFAAEPLARAIANLVHENDVGEFAKKVGAYKAAITGDNFDMDRKNKTPLSFQWVGFDVQCFNEEVPRVKDKSGSFLRRLLLVPFDKWFGGDGVERRYIKHEYLARQDVLRYVLKRALHMGHQQLSEPAACLRTKQEWVEGNNPVAGFWEVHKDMFVWDLLPFPFLYDMFKAWSRSTNPSGTPEAQTAFTRSLRAYVAGSPDWSDHRGKPVKVATRMTQPEYMIATYEMTSWYSPTYFPKPGTVPDLDRQCRPNLSTSYRGLVRTQQGSAGAGNDDEHASASNIRYEAMIPPPGQRTTEQERR